MSLLFDRRMMLFEMQTILEARVDTDSKMNKNYLCLTAEQTQIRINGQMTRVCFSEISSMASIANRSRGDKTL